MVCSHGAEVVASVAWLGSGHSGLEIEYETHLPLESCNRTHIGKYMLARG